MEFSLGYSTRTEIYIVITRISSEHKDLKINKLEVFFTSSKHLVYSKNCCWPKKNINDNSSLNTDIIFT